MQVFTIFFAVSRSCLKSCLISLSLSCCVSLSSCSKCPTWIGSRYFFTIFISLWNVINASCKSHKLLFYWFLLAAQECHSGGIVLAEYQFQFLATVRDRKALEISSLISYLSRKPWNPEYMQKDQFYESATHRGILSCMVLENSPSTRMFDCPSSRIIYFPVDNQPWATFITVFFYFFPCDCLMLLCVVSFTHIACAVPTKQ